jgi:predicted transposase YdaD
MDQELPPNRTVRQEMQALGGLPLTHAKLFKEMFQWLGLVRAFLRFVLPGPILAKLDLDNLTIEPGDFLSTVFRETRADMIYRLPILGRKESLCVYVVLEHKSYNDFFAIFQADGYASQISQREFRQADDEERLTVDFRLSPVLVIIFHHGPRPFTGARDLAEVYADYDVFTDYIPHRRAIVFDLSTLPESEVPDDPEVPELFAVLRIMQVIFSLDLGLKIQEVFKRLRPYSATPKYRRLIRFLYYYFSSYAEKQSAQEFKAVSEAVKAIIGETEMSTILEHFKAEGKAEGEAIGVAKGKVEGEAIGVVKGKVLAILEVRFNRIPQEVGEAVQSMTDLIALESLVEQAKACRSLEEFREALR